MKNPRQILITALGLLVVVGTLVLPATVPVHAANAIVTENQKAGTDGWQIPEPNACDGNLPIAACQESPPNTIFAEHREIEGYASGVSVPLGGQVSFMVSVRTAMSYYMLVYRLGWYGGLGGRLMTPPGATAPAIGPLQGIVEPFPTVGAAPDYLIEANWPAAYTLNVPATWTSGYYIVKLVRADGYEALIPFTVRNDASTAPILMQASVTTWQAYNQWGGKNLYGSFNTNVSSPNYGLDITGPAAGVVSFDRPYGPQDFMGWELEMVRYLERTGRDVTYVTDVDTNNDPNLLLRHATFLSVGHDEYWSDAMRTNVTNARDHGINIGFFGANAVYFHIKFAADSNGGATRRIVCYKNPAIDPVTLRWRDEGLPENALIGEMSDGAADSNNYIISDASSWIFNGAGVHNGSVITGLVGYEYDRTWANGATPAGLQVVAHSPTLDGSYSESSIYTAPSGAIVFAAGTIQWSSGLDDYRYAWANGGNGVPASPAIQKTMSNLLDKMSIPPPPPPPVPTVTGISPTSGPAAGGTVVTINGTNFSTTAGTTRVAFGGVPATGVSCATTTTCTATSPAGSGLVDVTVIISGETSPTGPTDQYTYPGPPIPTVSGISPTSGPSAGGTPVTVTGTNFSATAGSTTVGFGGASASSVSCSNSTSCSVISPAGTGTVDVRVTVGGQTSSANSADQFTYAPGAGLIFTDGFESGNLTAWDGAAGTGSTAIATAAAHTGSFGARMMNTSGQYALLIKQLSSPLNDSYTRFAVRFTSITTATTVAYGRDAASSAIRWELIYDRANQALQYYLFNSAGASSAITTSKGSAPTGAWLIIELRYNGATTGGGQIWINDASQPGWSLTGDYSNTAPYQRLQLWNDSVGTVDFDDVTVSTSQTAPQPPVVSTINPSSGPGGGGTVVTITGANFGVTPGTTSVAFGGAAASGVSCSSTSSCIATSPAGAGPADVTVTVGGQTSATGAADVFNYPPPPPPAVSAIDPNSGPAAGGSVVTISGTGFSTSAGGTTVHFGSVAATAVCSTTTTCTATSPAGTGTVDITVTVLGQTSATGVADQFSFLPGVMFSDGFGSGNLQEWDEALGAGSVQVLAAAAHAGSWGLRMSDSAAGQYGVLVKLLPTSLNDSYTSFAVRFLGTTGLTTVATGRDASSNVYRWILYYNPPTQSLLYYIFDGSGQSSLITVAGVSLNTWTIVELRYNGTATGGGQVWINGATQASWMVSGNFANTAPYQRLQLWNDAVGTSDFDDVSVSTLQKSASLPTVTGVSPTSGPAAGGTLVTVTGTNFDPSTNGTSINFGSAPASGVSCASTTSCTATSPPGTGVVDVTATVGGSTSATSPADHFAYPPPPAPSVSGVSPAIGPGAGGTSVTVTGDNFSTTAGATAVSFGSAPAAGVTCPSVMTCTATSPAGSGIVDVRVTVGGQTSAASAADQFTYTGAVFSDGFESGTLSVWDGAQGSGTTTVLTAAASSGIYGVRLNNSAAGQYALLVKRLPSSIDDSYTRFAIRFTGNGGLTTVAYGRDDSSSITRWILYYDPSVKGFIYYLFDGGGTSTGIATGPGSAPLGSWLTVELRYTGTASGGGQIWVNGVTQPTWSVSGNFANTAPYHRLQLWNDTVSASDFDDVTVSASQTAPPPPTVTAVSPNSGPAGGGTVATISGTNFGTAVGSTSVSFGGVAATGVSCNSASSCTATSPAGAGVVDVTVTAGALTSAKTSADQFTYPPPPGPTVTGVAPNSGAIGGGTVVAITGTNFSTLAGSTTVSFAGVAATGVSCTSTTNCSATSPAGTGTVHVQVTVGGQNSASSAADQFTYAAGVVFADGFESGTLSAWDGLLGSGTGLALAAAAHTGSYGARLSNSASGQYVVLVKRLPSSINTSYTRFAVRFTGASSITTVAYGRDDSSSAIRWMLLYNPSAQAFDYYLFDSSGVSTGIVTDSGSAPLGTWLTVELRYTGTQTGGGQIWINDQSQPSWSASGDFSNTAPYQRLQLWNDAVASTDFDDVTVSTSQTAPPAPQPTVSSINPASGPTGGGTVVAITGTNFSTAPGATSVRFGAASATAVSCASSTSCKVTSPSGVGSVDVTATVAGQTSPTSTGDLFGYVVPPAPTVSGINPTGGAAVGGTLVTINGSNFSTAAGATQVSFGSANATGVSCTSTTTCTATSPAGSGTVDVTVTVAGQVSAASAADQFTYAPGLVFADGFESGSLGAWDSAQGSGTISVANSVAHSGSYGARLANAANQFSLLIKRLPTSLNDSYTRFAVRFNGITGVTVVAYGRDDSSSAFRWILYYDPTAQAFTYYLFNGSGSSTPITTPNGSAPLGSWLIVELRYNGSASGGGQIWINDASQPSWSVSGNFGNSAPYQRLQLWNDMVGTADFDDVTVSTLQTAPPPPPAPTVGAIGPNTGPAAGGTAVTITGTNFSTVAGASTVSFGSAAGTAVNCASTTSCSATSPAGSGTVDVTVTVAGQSSATSAADQFTYAAPPPGAPAVTAIAPASGPTAGGTVVAITGTNFNPTAGATSVAFGGNDGTAVACSSTTSCTATSPAGAGTVDVRVTVSAQTSATSGADQFTYAAAPTVSSIAPSGGPAAGGTVVTITGTNFSTTPGATAIAFGSGVGSSVTCASATSCTATSPAGVGTVDVTASIGGLTSATSSADQFSYTAGPIFSDGFESGTLTAWDGAQGTGSTTVIAAGAHTGAFGVQLQNTTGQYAFLVKHLPTSLGDSYTRFAVRFSGLSGVTAVAYGRDDSSSVYRWILYYDPSSQAFTYYLFNGSGVSTAITTPNGVAPQDTWVTVELRYNGTATGGGQIWLNDVTQPGWSISGDFSNSAPYRRLQLWNEVAGTVDFDDVTVGNKQTAP